MRAGRFIVEANVSSKHWHWFSKHNHPYRGGTRYNYYFGPCWVGITALTRG